MKTDRRDARTLADACRPGAYRPVFKQLVYQAIADELAPALSASRQ